MVNDLSSYSKYYNAIPWGGYKILIVKVLTSDGTADCGAADTIDLSSYFTTIDGGMAFYGGTSQQGYMSCSWTGTTLTVGSDNTKFVFVLGH
jgi:hypothetical protein